MLDCFLFILITEGRKQVECTFILPNQPLKIPTERSSVKWINYLIQQNIDLDRGEEEVDIEVNCQEVNSNNKFLIEILGCYFYVSLSFEDKSLPYCDFIGNSSEQKILERNILRAKLADLVNVKKYDLIGDRFHDHRVKYSDITIKSVTKDIFVVIISGMTFACSLERSIFRIFDPETSIKHLSRQRGSNRRRYEE